MSEKKTQKELVLELLNESGSEGISALEILRHGVYRAAARVAELRAEGFEIETQHKAGRTAVYILRPAKPEPKLAPRIGADPSLWEQLDLGVAR